jgi:flap endonuclease-1
MGIKGLTSLINDNCADTAAITQTEIKTLFGRKVAIDAFVPSSSLSSLVLMGWDSSMSIYQFLIAVRQGDGQQLMNEQGETTRSVPHSHDSSGARR